MTDTLNVTGEFAPVDDIFISTETPEAEAPNGFVELGLAPELVQAVKDLG